MTDEPDVVDDGIGDRPTSAISRRRVQREALSVITTPRTISTRWHPVVDETDPEVTLKHCQWQQLLLRSRQAERLPLAGNSHGFRTSYRLSSESRNWTQHADMCTDIWTRTIHADHKRAWCYDSIWKRTRYNEAERPRIYRSIARRTSDAGTIWTIFSRIGEIRGHGGVGKQIAARDE